MPCANRPDSIQPLPSCICVSPGRLLQRCLCHPWRESEVSLIHRPCLLSLPTDRAWLLTHRLGILPPSSTDAEARTAQGKKNCFLFQASIYDNYTW